MYAIRSYYEYVDNVLDGKLFSVTCRIFRKDRTRPTELTEYMSECAGTSEPWKKWPARMLRHKATIQCARYAFGLSGRITSYNVCYTKLLRGGDPFVPFNNPFVTGI